MKELFINKEIFLLTTSASFQRANVYKKIRDEKEVKYFKNMLQGYLQNLVENDYQKQVSENIHLENIKQLSVYSENFSKILNNGKLNFGVSQKLLNLYLKYMWCLGKISTPPHFPVDRIIQVKLNIPEIYAWTKMEDEQDYLEVINYAKDVLKELKYKNLSELELNLFSRK